MIFEYLYDEDSFPILINKKEEEKENNYNFFDEEIRKNYHQYSNINNNIYLILSLSFDYKQYKLRTCNYVNISNLKQSKNILFTTYDVLIEERKDTKLFLFIKKEEDIQEFISYIKHLLSIDDLNLKLDFLEKFKKKFNLLNVEINNIQSNFRNIFLKQLDYLKDYILREPKNEKILNPPINVLFLNCYHFPLNNKPAIKINIDSKNNNNNKIVKYTFLSYKIPIKSINFDRTNLDFKEKTKLDILLSYAKIHKFEHIIKIPISYKEDIINQNRFNEGYYLQTIHFGEFHEINEKSIQEILNHIYECNLGTIVFDLDFNPIGFIGNKTRNLKFDSEKYYITFFNSEQMNFIFKSILEIEEETRLVLYKGNNNNDDVNLCQKESDLITINNDYNKEISLNLKQQVDLTLKKKRLNFIEKHEVEIKYMGKKTFRNINFEKIQDMTFSSFKKINNLKIDKINNIHYESSFPRNNEIVIKKEKIFFYDTLSDGSENINEEYENNIYI